MLQRQRTIHNKASLVGVGLHSGKKIRLNVFPAGENEGIVFLRRAGQKFVEIPAQHQNIVDTRLATTLGCGGELVATVEHFLAAMYGLGIDNLRVEIDGPEIPIMDGSAAAFVDMVRKAGIEQLSAQKRFWVVTKPVTVKLGDRVASLKPASQFSISCAIDFNHPVISAQRYHWEFSDQAFHRDIAQARTFGLLKDVENLKRMGLVLGGALENAIVVDDFNILNAGGLRYPDEFVRHKLLDGLGDLALLGHPIIGKVTLNKAGHSLHRQLLEKAMKLEALVPFQPELEVTEHHYGELPLRLPVWAAPSEIFAL